MEDKRRIIKLSALSLEQAEEIMRVKKKNKDKDIEEIAEDLGYLESDSFVRQRVR